VSKLIIVESPAKAKTIKSFLGKGYTVLASKGHIRDLPKRKIGVKVDNGQFDPEYVIDADHKEVVKEIKSAAKKADEIYIATDEDREGEAIGYHIAVALDKDPLTLPRIVFHEITKTAINNALENPRILDMARINAQQARRILDRLVGYKLSPLLGSKIQKGLSAGRVQSSSLKLVVDREREIKAFIPEEYWTLDGVFPGNIDAKLFALKDEKLDKFAINNEKDAKALEARLAPLSYTIAEIETKERKTAPQPPFMTSTLQQSASSMMSFSPKKTMMIAQKLYEGVATDQGTMGLITYMRTDSLYITPEANGAARDYIEKTFGEKYLASKVRVFKTKSKQAQEAHEAIRPTRIDFTPSLAANYLKPDELKLYRLIYNRFIASQMTEAVSETQNIFFDADDARFKASGKRLLFDGFYKVYGDSDKDNLLPALKKGESLSFETLSANQHFTEPPSRYSEAGLVKVLESLGIGRPSTYAPTISILQQRGYINLEKRQIIPTEIAFKVTELLEAHFSEIVDSNFTATMENDLDEVAYENRDWHGILWQFYEPFLEKVTQGKTAIKSQKVAEPIGEKCPDCGEELLKRKGRYGEFISCSAFPKCKYTRNMDEDAESAQAQNEPTGIACDKCGGDMVIKNGRNGKFYACSNYPKCKSTKPLTPPKELDIACPKCKEGHLVERSSRRGKFFGCHRYPDCDFITNSEPSKQLCPECNTIMGKKLFRKKPIFECLNPACKHRMDNNEA